MSGVPEQSHAELRLDDLPPLAQSQAIRMLAPRLWENKQVVAIWLGGSLAAGTGDPYSDIDLRVAVSPDDLPDGKVQTSTASSMGQRWPGNW